MLYDKIQREPGSICPLEIGISLKVYYLCVIYKHEESAYGGDDLDDSVTTNNGDTDKVLATVAYTIYEFFEEFPDAIVYLSGVTPSRTRLYQINISKFFDHISNDFEVLGELEEGLERFKKNINYLGFAIKQK